MSAWRTSRRPISFRWSKHVLLISPFRRCIFVHLSVRRKSRSNRDSIGVLEVAIGFECWQERYFLRHFCELEHFSNSCFAFQCLSFNLILFFNVSVLVLFASQVDQRVLEFLSGFSNQVPCFFVLPIRYTRYLMEHVFAVVIFFYI